VVDQGWLVGFDEEELIQKANSISEAMIQA
jgi:hypothetical protein